MNSMSKAILGEDSTILNFFYLLFINFLSDLSIGGFPSDIILICEDVVLQMLIIGDKRLGVGHNNSDLLRLL